MIFILLYDEIELIHTLSGWLIAPQVMIFTHLIDEIENFNTLACWKLTPDCWLSHCYMMKYIPNVWNQGYDSDQNVYEIHLTGTTI